MTTVIKESQVVNQLDDDVRMSTVSSLNPCCALVCPVGLFEIDRIEIKELVY